LWSDGEARTAGERFRRRTERKRRRGGRRAREGGAAGIAIAEAEREASIRSDRIGSDRSLIEEIGEKEKRSGVSKAFGDRQGSNFKTRSITFHFVFGFFSFQVRPEFPLLPKCPSAKDQRNNQSLV
jgi:hypothetical protein